MDFILELLPTGSSAMIVLLTMSLMVPFAVVYLFASRPMSRKLTEVPVESPVVRDDSQRQSRAA